MNLEELADELRVGLGERLGSRRSSFAKHRPRSPHLSPDAFKRKWGRCPAGFNTDPETGRCAPVKQTKAGPSGPYGEPAATVKQVALGPHVGEPAATVKQVAAPAPEPSPEHKKEHGFLKKALHGVWHALSDPFKKAWKLATDKKYRTEVKDFVVKAAKKEGTQTKAMAGTFAKLLKGEKVSREEKLAAMDQMADIVKVAAMSAMVGHIAGGGIVKLAATLASPADELAGIAIDKPLRAITKKMFGREHGILPTSFYEEGVRYSMLALLSETYKEGDEYKLIETMVDAITAEMGKMDLSDEDIMNALMKSGLRAKKKNVIDKIISVFSSKKEDKKVPCGKCGRTTYNDIRGQLGDCCLKKESLSVRMNALL